MVDASEKYDWNLIQCFPENLTVWHINWTSKFQIRFSPATEIYLNTNANLLIDYCRFFENFYFKIFYNIL